MPTKKEEEGDGVRRSPGIERRFSESGLGMVKSFQAPLGIMGSIRFRVHILMSPLFFYF